MPDQTITEQPSEPVLEVRTGTPEDIHDLMELAKLASEENGFIQPSEAKQLDDIWQALHLNHGIVGIIGPPGGKPEGAVLLRLVSLWYSDQQVVEERGIFIHPDHRSAKGGRASRMCEFSKRVAERMGLPLLIGVLSNHRTEAKVRLYKRHFGQPAGAYFLYNAHTGGAAGDTPAE
jgi:hypothetical protein